MILALPLPVAVPVVEEEDAAYRLARELMCPMSAFPIAKDVSVLRPAALVVALLQDDYKLADQRSRYLMLLKQTQTVGSKNEDVFVAVLVVFGSSNP